jgi:hypothetical protein
MSSPQATVYQRDYNYDNVRNRSEKKYENDTGKKVLYDYNDDGMSLLWTASGTQGSKSNVTGKFTEDNVQSVEREFSRKGAKPQRRFHFTKPSENSVLSVAKFLQ